MYTPGMASMNGRALRVGWLAINGVVFHILFAVDRDDLARTTEGKGALFRLVDSNWDAVRGLLIVSLVAYLLLAIVCIRSRQLPIAIVCAAEAVLALGCVALRAAIQAGFDGGQMRPQTLLVEGAGFGSAICLLILLATGVSACLERLLARAGARLP
jgi:hypothetical protein